MRSILNKTAMAVLLGCVMSFPVQAAVPTDASLKQLMVVTKSSEMMEQMITPDNNMMDQLLQSSLESFPQDEMDDHQRQELSRIISKYNKEMFNEAFVNKIEEQMIAAYIRSAKKHFTQEEVDAQIDFYSTDVGQSIVNKQPAMLQEYMKEAMPIAMEASMQQIQKIMPKMQAEIEALGLED
ncbi:DUF2059 domain-containing protein [Psychrobacter pygoscelis]|uniref:DUF2059 domain-containing protein n=1 Tax=Psychrobacter pygoscelis TaxID=2488563 RepID=UPI00103EA722|nr:DUF2059 domain-containing protein [Psychrobacter pygoscelis]